MPIVLDNVVVALVRTVRIELDVHTARRHVTATIIRQRVARLPATVVQPEIGLGFRREVDVVVAEVDIVMLPGCDHGRVGQCGQRSGNGDRQGGDLDETAMFHDEILLVR